MLAVGSIWDPCSNEQTEMHKENTSLRKEKSRHKVTNRVQTMALEEKSCGQVDEFRLVRLQMVRGHSSADRGNRVSGDSCSGELMS